MHSVIKVPVGRHTHHYTNFISRRNVILRKGPITVHNTESKHILNYSEYLGCKIPRKKTICFVETKEPSGQRQSNSYAEWDSVSRRLPERTASLRLKQSPTQWVMVIISVGLKRLWRKVVHSPASSAKNK
jgi:hypothetical protein